MARIHGISGSTRYLLNGSKSINGKRLATLEEIIHFQSNYEEILIETKIAAGKRQDEIILSLSDRETNLDQQLQDDINKRTREVYTHIIEINDRIVASDSFFVILAYLIQFWGANLISSYRIHLPLIGQKWNLWRLRKRKEKTIADKPHMIKSACKNITDTQQFLSYNNSFLIGADGEEHVISVLSQLPDEFHILNDVNLHFFDSIYWRERRERIRNCQIDHLVIGPTGIFLLETKNWKRSDIKIKSDDLKRQVRRANYALWYFLKDHYGFFEKSPKIRNVVVSLHGSEPDMRIDKYIDVISPYRLCGYITARESTLSEVSIHKLIRLIPCREGN
jgi:sulfur relay (sulfurtransferase) DsrC/TusE family protein